MERERKRARLNAVQKVSEALVSRQNELSFYSFESVRAINLLWPRMQAKRFFFDD